MSWPLPLLQRGANDNISRRCIDPAEISSTRDCLILYFLLMASSYEAELNHTSDVSSAESSAPDLPGFLPLSSASCSLPPLPTQSTTSLTLPTWPALLSYLIPRRILKHLSSFVSEYDVTLLTAPHHFSDGAKGLRTWRTSKNHYGSG